MVSLTNCDTRMAFAMLTDRLPRFATLRTTLDDADNHAVLGERAISRIFRLFKSALPIWNVTVKSGDWLINVQLGLKV